MQTKIFICAYLMQRYVQLKKPPSSSCGGFKLFFTE